MDTPHQYLVVLVTTSSEEEAQRIAHTLLEKKLIACANLIPIRSLFFWENKVQDEAEVLMIIKTTSAIFNDELIAAIKAEHSYQVPEIIGMPIVLGSLDYLKWISDTVK
jgi:periplasmic divalent cation tolerance protein